MSEHMLVAQKHFQAFRKFENFQKSKSTAKDKLTKLSQHQFQELSTDVYDELLRREKDLEEFLPPIALFHPKRNQARQKLCTLQRARFDELVSDVFHEICNRYPSVTRKPSLPKLVIPNQGASKAAPLGSASGVTLNSNLLTQSSTISHSQPSLAPRKTTLERGAVDLPGKFLPEQKVVNFASLDNLMADLGGLMNEGAYSADPKSPSEKTESISDLQKAVETMKFKMKEKDHEIGTLTQDAQKASKQKAESESQLKNLNNELAKIKADYAALQKSSEAEKQTQSRLKTESASLLAEVKTLSVENASLRGAKDKLSTQINQLFDQIAELKEKQKILEKENEELKSKKSLSPSSGDAKMIPNNIIVSRTNPNIDFQKDQIENNMFRERLEEYYIAVNTLLSESRSQEEPSASILIAMKSVVLACKSLTTACEDYEHKLGNHNNLTGIKSQMSTALTNQMLSCKQASLTPTAVSKLNIEKELLVLTTVVLELAKASQDLDKSSSPSQRSPSTKSPHTPLSDKDGASLYELKNFLESQTDQIVKSIQALLALLKQSKYSSQDFLQTINSISNIVTSLVDASQAPLRKAQIDCDPVIDLLIKSRDGLVELAGRVVKDPSSRNLKQQVASSSYEIAKQVKKLIGLID